MKPEGKYNANFDRPHSPNSNSSPRAHIRRVARTPRFVAGNRRRRRAGTGRLQRRKALKLWLNMV